MNPPGTILVPTDFSDTADAAFEYALVLAGKLDAKIHLLHVIALPAHVAMEMGAMMPPAMSDSLEKETREALEALATRSRAKASIATTMIEIGDTRDVIIDVAARINADLIIIGTHGRRGLKRALLGSVAEWTVRAAPCPVLTVPHRERT